uniref:hypothetical protein n=1 Tax=Thaumasiovibrio occultus TaxID=1891184 RepID=UPI00131DF4E3|nr:hypothetical protein [Thaumasiovibrio occultus]
MSESRKPVITILLSVVFCCYTLYFANKGIHYAKSMEGATGTLSVAVELHSWFLLRSYVTIFGVVIVVGAMLFGISKGSVLWRRWLALLIAALLFERLISPAIFMLQGSLPTQGIEIFLLVWLEFLSEFETYLMIFLHYHSPWSLLTYAEIVFALYLIFSQANRSKPKPTTDVLASQSSSAITQCKTKMGSGDWLSGGRE